MPIQIQYRRGTALEWSAANTVLAIGEPGYETDSGRFKVGDGSTAWNSLPYSSGLPAPILPTFTYQGSVTTYTGKGRFYLDRAGTLTLLRASLGTASSSGAVGVTLLKNGVSVGTVSVSASSFTNTAPLSTSISAGDYLTVNITSAGTGATDLVVEVSIV